MNKIKVLYLVVDPYSASRGGPRLLLDEEIHAVRKKIRAAKYGDALDLDVHWAVRATDLLDTLNEVQPDVLHFSGHGDAGGIVLVGPDGRSAHRIGGKAISALLKAAGGGIRLVVLSAVESLKVAESIRSEVSCAIGIQRQITDEAAIAFNAAFYGALASGYSVQKSFDHARAEMTLAHLADVEELALVVGPGVDPARIVLLPGNEPHTVVSEVPHLVVAPTVFTIPAVERDPELVSVVMPFAKEYARTYQAIKKACESIGFRCERGDTIWQESTVIQDVFNLIYRSAAVVVDLSERNPNVMYECGIAHTLGRPVVPISRSNEDLPFDVIHHRTLHYIPDAEGHARMRKQLESRLKLITRRAS